MNAAVITISTSAVAGEREDVSGEVLAEAVAEAGGTVVARELIPDDQAVIEQTLRRHASPEADTPLIFTTGGTGLTPDDVTPEATRAVIDRDAPGFAEAMRAESLRYTPMGILSRGVSGISGRTLIVNFPGNPKSIRELFPVIAPVLEHAVGTLQRDGGGPAGH